MPRWTTKFRRMYEHIKDSALSRGVPEDRAEEVAGRTVNKKRRQEGRTPNTRTMGTGNPNLPLAQHTRDELYNLARQLGITGRSRMNKQQLVLAIEHAR